MLSIYDLLMFQTYFIGFPIYSHINLKMDTYYTVWQRSKISFFFNETG